MLYSLKIKLHDEKITITSIDGQFLKDGIAVVAFDEKEKVLSVGETLEYIKEQSPNEWERLKSKIYFCYPFSIDNFQPKLAGISVNYWAYLASHISVESQKSILKDSVDLQIRIPGYEKLEQDVQELFEYYVQKSWMVKVKGLSINNQSKTISFGWAEWALRIGFPIMFFILFFIVFKIAEITMGTQLSAPIPSNERVTSFVIVIAIMFFLIYLGLFISVAIWKIVVKSYISDVVSIAIIENSNLGLPKPLLKLLRQKPFAQNNGG
jgi:hypothetical protein